MKLFLFTLLVLGAPFISLFLVKDSNIPVLFPKGWVGIQEKNLLVVSTLIMLIVVIPVFIMTFFFAWKYRAKNTQATYSPDWDYSLLAEGVWVGVPLIIIIVLSFLVWESSHTLDPYRPLEHQEKPLTVQVVALDWKWLFIYPEQHIASVNYLQIPEKTPIHFEITADAPMNSFWIPQLGGQIFAMPGMKTQLHLIADEPGSYTGASANLSGDGFAGMYFMSQATPAAEFENWVQECRNSSQALTRTEYKKLAQPSKNNPPCSYVLEDKHLFDWIVMKYMMPMKDNQAADCCSHSQ